MEEYIRGATGERLHPLHHHPLRLVVSTASFDCLTPGCAWGGAWAHPAVHYGCATCTHHGSPSVSMCMYCWDEHFPDPKKPEFVFTSSQNPRVEHPPHDSDYHIDHPHLPHRYERQGRWFWVCCKCDKIYKNTIGPLYSCKVNCGWMVCEKCFVDDFHPARVLNGPIFPDLGEFSGTYIVVVPGNSDMSITSADDNARRLLDAAIPKDDPFFLNKRDIIEHGKIVILNLAQTK